MSAPQVHSGERSRPYDELRDRAARVAAGLHALGVRRGDRVATTVQAPPARSLLGRGRTADLTPDG